MPRAYEYTQERIDIYDRDRHYTGRSKPRHGEGSRLSPDEYMLYALALIENDSGEFLITQRTMDKKWAPGAWEIPGGGVDSGETSREAADREAYEETGIRVQGVRPVSVYTYRNDDAEGGDNYFCDIYHFRLDFKPGQVRVEADEVSSWRLAPFSEITRLAQCDGFLHYKRICEALGAEK
ncbi:MAG: NUDIX hydrolase [Lachnospira sp.]|nr:NUDIX hydrolase [Lachnospira sp.]